MFTGKLLSDRRTRLCRFSNDFLNSKFFVPNLETICDVTMSIKTVKLSRINVESLKRLPCQVSCHSDNSSYLCEPCETKNTHFWPSWIALRTVTIYRPGTQTNKLKLTLANFLSFVWLLSFKCYVYLSSVITMRKMTKLRQKLPISHSDVIRALRYYNPIYLANFRLVRKIF